MGRSQNFSIYLLKKGFNPGNSLKDNHNMTPVVNAQNLPNGAIMYLADNHPKLPWWKTYWGVSEDI